MKYIITENRLNKVIFKYLDMELSGLEQVETKSDNIVFKLPNKENGILRWEKSGNLGIYYELSDNISYMFGLNSTDSMKVIGEWVEDKYNLKVIKTHLKWVH